MPNKWKTERDTTFLFVRYGRVVVPKFAVTFYKATFAFSGQNLITSGVKKLRYSNLDPARIEIGRGSYT